MNRPQGRTRLRCRSGAHLPTWLRRLLVLACLAAPLPAAGQELPLKRSLAPAAEPARCGAAPAVELSVPPEKGAAVDSLLAAGSRAAILGDHYTAGELLREAAARDPRNPVIAYRLARTYEERRENQLAVAEYCRYLLVAPNAPDTADVHERVRQLSATTGEVDREELAAATRAGLQAYDQGRYAAAALAFGRVVEMRPHWAAAHFNRALAHQALEQLSLAAAGLERYLDLLPDAEDRAAVHARLAALRSTVARAPSVSLAPDGALVRGLVVPGLGQHATGRSAAGIVVLGSAAGAVYYGLREEVVVSTQSARDPFGNPYEFEVRSLERPHLLPGLGAAAAIGIAAAVEAYLYARRNQAPGPTPAEALASQSPSRRRLHASALPSRGGIELRLRFTSPVP